jgi:hypothetical protein
MIERGCGVGVRLEDRKETKVSEVLMRGVEAIRNGLAVSNTNEVLKRCLETLLYQLQATGWAVMSVGDEREWVERRCLDVAGSNTSNGSVGGDQIIRVQDMPRSTSAACETGNGEEPNMYTRKPGITLK